MADSNGGVEQEIEVAYLPKSLPDSIGQIQPTRVMDIYFSSDSDLLTKLRLRQRGDSYEMTKKVNIDPNDLSLQNEYTIPLTEAEFAKLRSAGGREVVKDRYVVPFGKTEMEVDIFRGKLEGFVLIEVEFSSIAERDALNPPEYFGADVTQEDFIAGAYLAGKSYGDIAPELERLGYKPLYLR